MSSLKGLVIKIRKPVIKICLKHNEQVLSTDFRRIVNFGIKTIMYKAPSLWAKLPSEYKLEASLEEFKVKIKK